jgi:uncharacterized protein YjhX (UPF0386 family)
MCVLACSLHGQHALQKLARGGRIMLRFSSDMLSQVVSAASCNVQVPAFAT